MSLFNQEITSSHKVSPKGRIGKSEKEIRTFSNRKENYGNDKK